VIARPGTNIGGGISRIAMAKRTPASGDLIHSIAAVSALAVSGSPDAHRGCNLAPRQVNQPERPTSFEGAAVSLVRVHNFSVSLDGFATGEGQALETPFGHAGHRLHEWMFGTRFAREMFGEPGGAEGVDHVMAARHGPGIGAEIMGAGKFGPPGWQDDPEWRGWWGDNPPFHTPTYILTHRPRPPLEMEAGTTFHFLDATPAAALEVARDAAAGQDVRIGGGPTMMRAFLAAGLVDQLHVVQVPILLGRGVRLWDGLEALEQQYKVEVFLSPSGVTHLTFTR